MKKSSKVIAFLMCFIMGLSITAEAQATTDNKIRIFEMGDGFEVYLDQSQAQRSNELTCLMSIYKEDEENQIVVTFSTLANMAETPSEIGVRDFVFQKKGWLFWDTIYSNSFCDYNDNYYTGGIVYSNPEEGEKYRAIGTHYAIVDGEEYTYISISAEVQ